MKKYCCVVFFLFLFLLSFFRDIISGEYFFSHPDFSGLYYPFRTWFHQWLSKGVFPFWNPLFGSGTTATIWTTIPVDLLTPIQLLGFNDYNWLLVFNSFGLIIASFFLMLHITKNHALSALLAILFFTSPWTGYFLPYYIHTGSFTSAVLCLLALLKFKKTGRGILWISLASLLGTLGTKLELSVYNGIFFFVSVLFLCGRKSLKPLLAYGLGIALNAGTISLVLNAYLQSYRAGTFGSGFHHLLNPVMWGKFWYHLNPLHWTSETEDLSTYWQHKVWLGVIAVLLVVGWAFRNRVYRLGLIWVLVFLFFRYPGNVLTTHLFGAWWMPNRGNYLLELGLVLMAGAGLARVRRWVAWTCLLLTLFSAKDGITGFHQWFSPSPGYPAAHGIPKLMDVLGKLKVGSGERVQYTTPTNFSTPTLYGSNLLMGVGQGGIYESLAHRSYLEFVNFYRHGWNPEERCFFSPYTKAEESKLPDFKRCEFPGGVSGYDSLLHYRPSSNDLMWLASVRYWIRDDFAVHDFGSFLPVFSTTGYDISHVLPSIAELKSNYFTPAHAEWVNPNFVRILTFGSKGDYLLAMVSSDPGWSVYHNGSSTKPIKALGSFVGVRLGDGSNRIEMRYFPAAIIPGILVSLLAALIYFSLVLKDQVRIEVLKFPE